MFDSFQNNSEYFKYFILPLIIFCMRIIDVTLGTLRVMFVLRSYKKISAFLGFIEVFIWITVVGQIMQNLNNIICFIAYAGGFSTGTFVGIWLENKLSFGRLIIRIITSKESQNMIQILRNNNFGVTVSEAVGKDGRVKIIFSSFSRKDLKKVLNIIQENIPDAFYTIEDVRFVNDNVSNLRKDSNLLLWFNKRK